MSRVLFGPCDDPVFRDRFLQEAVETGDWQLFSAAAPTWEAALNTSGFVPDVVVVWPGYHSVPPWVWSAPVPVAAAAHDANLLFHGYRRILHLADLVLTDAPSAARLRRAGLTQVRSANLYGLDRHFAAGLDEPERERPIDVVFVGNLNPAVQRKRLAWLGRLARLADRCRVVIATGVFGAEYRQLLRQARLVFNHSIRGECNLRALEAAASGAVLLQEADNQEVSEYLRPGVEYAPYTSEDFEAVAAGLLGDEATRAEMAEAAKERVRHWSFAALVNAALSVGGTGWSEVKERAAVRRARRPRMPLSGRVWQRASLAGVDADSGLAAELAGAQQTHSLAILARSPAEAEEYLRGAAADNRVAAVGLASTLLKQDRLEAARVCLDEAAAALEHDPELSAEEADSVPYPACFDALRAAWEEAAFNHPDDALAERRAKARLVLGWALMLRAQLTGASADWQAAIDACPPWPRLRTTLGQALVQEGKFNEAITHLRNALDQNPFDNAAAQSLAGALRAAGHQDELDQHCQERQLLAQAAPGLIADLVGKLNDGLTQPLAASDTPPDARPDHALESGGRSAIPAHPIPIAEEPSAIHASSALPTPRSPPADTRPRFLELTPADFAARFGSPDTRAALAGFTSPADTHAVLTLLVHAQARRILEIGTAAGHMTANLTAYSPPDALVYSIGLVAEDSPHSGTPHQDYEVPRRQQFAQFLNHFGTAHKALVATADSRGYDFSRLGVLDFVFVDGGHDLATARSDSLAAYRVLRPGGILVWHDVPSPTPWVEVRQAIAELAFPEAVYQITGTQVAFLIKGEGLGARAAAASAEIAINWDGAVDALHSLSCVNRALCAELAARGHTVALLPQPPTVVPAARLAVPPELAALSSGEVPGAVHVRHRWPPDFSAPAGTGPLVLIQPWEFGRLPRSWIEPILNVVDELWVPSRAVLRACAASGIPECRVAVVPNGVDPDRFRPDSVEPLPLSTHKRFKFLFVGGTIPRKGIDVLLNAYRGAFHRGDDVALVVKDMGVGSFYRHQTAQEAIGRFQRDPDAPELIYLSEELADEEMARLYHACDVLVHPYRGEGFGLPVLEAMACGLPVAVTAGGATDEFVPPSAGWRIPAQLRYFETEAVGDLPTVGRPWWLEPDSAALTAILREATADSPARQRRGQAARRAAEGYSWSRSAAVVEDRIRVLRSRTPIRFRRDRTSGAARPTPPVRAFNTLSTPLPTAPAVTLRADEPLIIDVSSRTETPRTAIPAVAGRPRVCLTMIVKNEEQHLADCLASIRDLVDDAIVIDTGSTDRTRAIAESFGCRVGEFPWIDHFAAARNAALDAARGDYAFWMDADDRLDAANRLHLKSLLARLPSGNAAFVMKCLCVGQGNVPGSAGTAVDHVRLFRLHPAHRWTYRVHEQILPALRATGADVQWPQIVIRHVGYIDPAVRRRKLDRDLRLLHLDLAERPDDPFTLFNLGSVYQELGKMNEAIGVLQKSLTGSHPADSIVRKTYAILARCHHQTGDRSKAEAVCRQGRQHYPDDAELVFLAAGLARDGGDVRAAEELYRKLINGNEGPHFASVDTGLRAVKGRHNLAVLLMEQARWAEAEAVWRAALVHDPNFLPAQVGLGELCILSGNAAGLVQQVEVLSALGEPGQVEAAVLKGRGHSARGEHAQAAAVLEEAIARMPGVLALRVALSHLHIAAGSPPEVLESALRGVLALDPGNAQARHNLEVLYRNTGRWIEGVLDEPPSPPAEDTESP